MTDASATQRPVLALDIVPYEDGDKDILIIGGPAFVAVDNDESDHNEAAKFASRIVRAVNSFDALVAAGAAFVERAEMAASEPGGAPMRTAPEWKLVTDMRAALALAGGETQ